MICFERVSKLYGDTSVIKNFTLNIQKGEFFVLVGSSGSGKTTVLKMINRLIEPTLGKIGIDGADIASYDPRELRLNIGYVLQQIALFPNLSVCENITLIAEMKRYAKKRRIALAKDLLARVGLEPSRYLHRYPTELSGGEQQRVGIIRAILTKPKILLMDEPFSALDPISRGELQELIKELHKDFGMTIVFVTHDMNEAQNVGERICVMNGGEILQVGTLQEIKDAPANEFVAKFFQATQT